jgi:Zn ribbon nucleic-acid-binding protein
LLTLGTTRRRIVGAVCLFCGSQDPVRKDLPDLRPFSP